MVASRSLYLYTISADIVKIIYVCIYRKYIIVLSGNHQITSLNLLLMKWFNVHLYFGLLEKKYK